MATTYYHTMNGRIRGQSTSGVRTDLLTDAIGSVIGTVNSTGSLVNQYRYKPYGEELSSSGAGTQPGFFWTGDTGSKRNVGNAVYAEQYNRARHYSTKTGQWTTIGQNVLSNLGYSYHLNNPISVFSVEYDGPYDIHIQRITFNEGVGCASINFHTRWIPTTSMNNVKGGVIQHIETVGFLTDCKTQKTYSFRDSFLEVWRWDGRSFFAADGDIDTFGVATSLPGGGDCTKGYSWTVGKSGFYKFDPRRIKPPEWNRGVGLMSGLFLKKPVPFDWKDGSTSKLLMYAWDCCADPMGYDWIAKCGPINSWSGNGKRPPGKLKECKPKC